MTYCDFNDGWRVSRASDGKALAVTLPHDAMLWQGRRADAPTGAHAGFFLGGVYRYWKDWVAPADLEGKHASLLFEGVYRHGRVAVNGHEIGGALSGYREFEVALDPALRVGAANLIEVNVDNADLPNSRWYTGSGIYRPVWLRITDLIHVKRGGVQFRTLSIDDPARVSLHVEVINPSGAPLEVVAALSRDGMETARGHAQTGGSADFVLEVARPALWSAHTPNLYECMITVSAAGVVRDAHALKVGLRTIEMSGRNGLRVNHEPTLLRGANIHHDNGVLGAATFRDAEDRRVRILKQQGFNAIRSAHNPASRALLDACDTHGMYVMDELFDGWYDHKTDHDDAPLFASIWPEEADAMVAKDVNHPCVIMYSIGNENTEPASAYGVETARRLAEHVRRLDPDRAVTAGVNLMAAALGWPTKRKSPAAEQPDSKSAPNMNSTMVNAVTNQFVHLMKLAPRLKRTDAATRDLFALLDVAGYNYGAARYLIDAGMHPDRVIVGTETLPGDIAKDWALVERTSNLIGEFIWAGWDYLGEAGIGSWEYSVKRTRLLKPYPQVAAGCGAIDITGTPGASALLAQIAWGLLEGPIIAVRPLDVVGKKPRKTAWRSTDAVSSWAWRGCEGRTAEIEIFARDDEVDVQINGHSLGRRRAGRAANYVTRFRAAYESGEIVAIGYRGGKETGRARLASAQRVRLRLNPETVEITANAQDLAFIGIELADEAGVIEMLDDDIVHVRVEGPAMLAGFGSAAPANEECFTANMHRTYRGRALAVVRAGVSGGVVRVTATSDRHGEASINLRQVAPFGRGDPSDQGGARRSIMDVGSQ